MQTTRLITKRDLKEMIDRIYEDSRDNDIIGCIVSTKEDRYSHGNQVIVLNRKDPEIE